MIFVLSDYQHFEYILNEYMCTLFSCLFVFVFPQGMTGGPLDPWGVCAVDVGHDVNIGVVHSRIAQGLQEYDLVMVMLLLLQRLHYFSPLPV